MEIHFRFSYLSWYLHMQMIFFGKVYSIWKELLFTNLNKFFSNAFSATSKFRAPPLYICGGRNLWNLEKFNQNELHG